MNNTNTTRQGLIGLRELGWHGKEVLDSARKYSLRQSDKNNDS